jgi:hypothetical protein
MATPIRRQYFIAIFLSLLTVSAEWTPAAAQNHAFQQWQPNFTSFPLRGRWRGYFETNPREGDGQLRQLLIRPALEYRASKRLSIFAGYCWNYIPNVPRENRPFQQITVTNQIKKLTLTNRSRLEQRIFDHLNRVSVRARHMVRASYPIVGSYYGVVYEELFVNLNTVENGPQKGIDQNRFFVGVGKQINRAVRGEIGYQLQYVNAADRFDDQANHTLLTQVFVNL